MAHLVLFLRSAGLCDVGDELGVRLLLKYVEVLITSRMTDLVATYTAHLPSTTQVSFQHTGHRLIYWLRRLLQLCFLPCSSARCRFLSIDIALLISKYIVPDFQKPYFRTRVRLSNFALYYSRILTSSVLIGIS